MENNIIHEMPSHSNLKDNKSTRPVLKNFGEKIKNIWNNEKRPAIRIAAYINLIKVEI
jgi:hypothetical protein